MRVTWYKQWFVFPILFWSAVLQAQITPQVSYTTFTDSNTTGWTLGGSGYKPITTSGNGDPTGQGWLRMTTPTNDLSTYAVHTGSFQAANSSVFTSFNYTAWGGTGADGLTFFLYDGSKTFSVGAFGGSLGYAQKTGINGVSGGYLGIAVDEYGNFSNPTEGRIGGVGFVPDAVAVRGPGSGQTGYNYLGGTSSLTPGLDSPNSSTRPSATSTGYNAVKMAVTPTNQVFTYLQQGSSPSQRVLVMDASGFQRPDTLGWGLSSGTGSYTNYHEVRNVYVATMQAFLWDNGGSTSTWNNGTNWFPNTVPNVGSDVLLDNTFVNTAQNIAISGTQSIRTLYIDAPFSYNLSGGTLNLSNNNSPGLDGIILSSTHGAAASHTISSNITLSNEVLVYNPTTAALNLSGGIANNGNKLEVGGSGVTNISGAMSGAGSLLKADGGNLSLSGNNSFAGGTTMQGGTLTLNSNTALGTGNLIFQTGNVTSTNATAPTVANNVQLQGSGSFSNLGLTGTVTQVGSDRTVVSSGVTYNNIALSSDNTSHTLTISTPTGTTSTVSGGISNGGTAAGNLIKQGDGNLRMEGTSSFTGNINIAQGSVTLGASNRFVDTMSMTLSGGTFNLNGFSEKLGSLTLNGGAVDFGPKTGANFLLFTADGNASQQGAPVSILNWQSGTDRFSTSQSSLSSKFLENVYFSGYGSGAVLSSTSETLTGYTGNWYEITPAAASWYVWDGGSTSSSNYTTKQNWVGDVAPPSANTTRVTFTGNARTSPVLDQDRIVNSLKFDANASSFTIGGTSKLTLDGTLPSIMQLSANAQTITAPVTINQDTILDTSGAGSLTISGNISGNYGLTKVGTGGDLILSGTNVFKGAVDIQGGVLEARNTAALGATSGGTTVENGATLRLAFTGSTGESLHLAGQGANNQGALTATGNYSPTVTGSITLDSATTITGSTTGTLTLAGGVTGNNTNLQVNGNVTVNSAVATGTGNVTLGANQANYNVAMTGSTSNTYTGITQVLGSNSGGASSHVLTLGKSSGATAIAGNLAIGSGGYGATVNLAASNQIADTATVTIGTGSSFNLSGFSETLGRVIADAGSNVALGGGTLTINNASESSLHGVVQGTGSIVKQGDGRLIVDNTNTSLTAGIQIQKGIVSAGASQALGTGGITVMSGGGLQVSGNSTLTNSFNLSGTSSYAVAGAIENLSGTNTLTGPIALAGATEIHNTSGSLTLTGSITGSQSLTFSGPGITNIKGGLNTGTSLVGLTGGTLDIYTAGNSSNINVSSGILGLRASNVLSDNLNLTLASGGTLDLNGFSDTIKTLGGTGSVLMDGGTLRLSGNSTFGGSFSGAGTLTLLGGSSLTLSNNISDPDLSIFLNGGTLNLNGYDASVGSIAVTANSTIDFANCNSSILTLLNSVTVSPGVTLTITNWTNATDFFYAVNNPGATNLDRITFQGWNHCTNPTNWQPWDHQITPLSPVPEPSTYGAIFTSLMLALAFWRKSRKPQKVITPIDG